MIHDLKCWPEFFQAMWKHEKLFEIRKNDRGFQVGDELYLQEYYPDMSKYTGRAIRATVTYLLDNPTFVARGYVAMSLGPLHREEEVPPR